MTLKRKKKPYRIIYIIIEQNEIKYRKSTPLVLPPVVG